MGLIVMATGGTGGHIYPATPTARELLFRGHEVILLGQQGGMEEHIATEQNLEFVGVEAGKLTRSGQGLPDPREFIKALCGLSQARTFLVRKRPGIVVGFGGFASLPGVLAAQSLGVRTVLHEQNARLGLTQRLAVKRARAVGTVYPNVIGLTDAKATLTGMPVREERLPRYKARAELGLKENTLTVLIMGGSQGSLALNRAVPEVLEHIFGPHGRLGEEQVQVLHSTGPRWLNEVKSRTENLAWYKAVGYTNAVAAWSAADLAITRAGTSTLAEAAYNGVPLVMVPLPQSAENHQYHNALSVQSTGAGRTILQAELERALGPAVLECALPATRALMREAALRRSPAGAASRLADLIERHLC